MFSDPNKSHGGYISYELLVSEDCNLRCKYCFDDQLSDRLNKDQMPDKMSFDIIPDIQNYILRTKSNMNGIQISFFGGEPLMNWPFIKKFVESSKEIFNFQVHYNIGTNGTLLTDEMIDFIIDNNINITISVDGKAKSHNLYRVFASKSPSFQRVVQRIPEIIAKRNPSNLGINMVVNPDTVDYLKENFDFIQQISHGSGQILFNFDSNWTEESLQKLERIWKEMFFDSDTRMPKQYEGKFVRNIQHSSYCINPTKNITISSTGKLFFCHRLTPKMVNVGDNYEEFYGDIYHGITKPEYYEWAVNRTQFDKWGKMKKCETCDVRNVCAGGCIAAHEYATKDKDGISEQMCKIYNIIYNQKLQERVRRGVGNQVNSKSCNN